MHSKRKRRPCVVAPHYDDEVIGCFEVLLASEDSVVVYTNERPPVHCRARIVEPSSPPLWPKISEFTFSPTLPKAFIRESELFTFYFPDPVYEVHPEHRFQGAFGEKLLRQGFDVVFYTTNMLAPYIHRVKDSTLKLRVLNNYYPNKSSLWEYDYKYFLFEGRIKWLM